MPKLISCNAFLDSGRKEEDKYRHRSSDAPRPTKDSRSSESEESSSSDDSEAPRRKSSSATRRDGKRKAHDIDKSNDFHKDKRGRDSTRKSKVVDSSREDSNSPRKSKKKVKKRGRQI